MSVRAETVSRGLLIIPRQKPLSDETIGQTLSYLTEDFSGRKESEV